MVSYLKRIDTGYAGDMTREPGPGDIVNEVLEPSVDWSGQGFGVPVIYTSTGTISPVASGVTADQIQGLLVRSFPGRAVSNTGLVAYPQINGGAVDVARRGFMAVVLRNSAIPTKGAPVYIRVANATTGLAIGGIEAAADGDSTIQLPNAQFEGPAGADGITEISFTIL